MTLGRNKPCHPKTFLNSATKRKARPFAIYRINIAPIFFGASFAIILVKPEVITKSEAFGPHSEAVIACMLFAGMGSVMLLEIWESYGKVFVNREKALPAMLQVASVVQLLVSGILVMALFDQFLK